MNNAVGPYDPCPCGSRQKFKFCCYKAGKRIRQSAHANAKGGFAESRATTTAPENADKSPKRKMSEMISDMAAGFIWIGDTIEERQNRLNAACTAWNMACGSLEIRLRQLEQYKDGYLRFNPAAAPTDLANIMKDMESLIEQKLKLFPDDKRQIVSARVVRVGETFRIEVASATLQ